MTSKDDAVIDPAMARKSYAHPESEVISTSVRRNAVSAPIEKGAPA